VALAGVAGTVGGDACDLLIDLAKKLGQHGRVTYVAACDLDRPDLQRLLVDPEVDLAPDPPFGAAMLARVPLALTLDLDPSAVDQKVQRTLRPLMGNVHGKRLLAAAERAEVRHVPVQADEPQ
jgi:hypothetical protein